MASVELKNICKVYPNSAKKSVLNFKKKKTETDAQAGDFIAVKDFNMEIEDGEFIVFVGPSGCGKSTTLRTLALKAGNMELLGQLLNKSHESLRDNYEVTGKEPDALVQAAQNQYCCLGSRLIGGGFGGCTISLVKSNCVEEFKKCVYNTYLTETGYKAEFYNTDIADGITVEKL